MSLGMFLLDMFLLDMFLLVMLLLVMLLLGDLILLFRRARGSNGIGVGRQSQAYRSGMELLWPGYIVWNGIFCQNAELVRAMEADLNR